MRPTSSKQILASCSQPALLISNCINIRYLTGVSVSAGYVLVTKSSIRFYVDPRYIETAKKNAYNTVEVLPLHFLPRSLKRIKTCGFEASDLTVARFDALKKKYKNISWKKTAGIIEQFRRSKDASEIKNFKKAQQITRQIMKKIPSMLQAGITEIELSQKIESLAYKLNADGMSFDSIVAFGENSSRPHHHPSKKKLSKNTVVQIDCGVKYNGYCADQSRVFFTGTITRKQQEVLDALHKTKAHVESLVAPGVSVATLDKEARKILKECNLEQYFTHALGHGVGLEIHEGVSLSIRSKKDVLLENEIITIEPGVYIEGKFGMRLEDELIVG